MTVRLEKSTRLPDSEPRKRPSLPFSLCVRVLSGLPERWCAWGIPETSLSKYVVVWYWSRSTRSCTMRGGVPASLLSFRRWFTRIISTILWVRSSSDLMPVSSIMEGRTVTGGTGSACSTNHSGLAVL